MRRVAAALLVPITLVACGQGAVLNRSDALGKASHEKGLAHVTRREAKLMTWPDFLKVSQSYRPGWFRCYESPDLPRTNHDLEHAFGSHRYHERRASGRKAASPGLVVRGRVRLVASAATRLREVKGEELAPRDLQQWQQLRQQLERRQESRRRQRRFRRDPNSYLRILEEKMHQSGLLP